MLMAAQIQRWSNGLKLFSFFTSILHIAIQKVKLKSVFSILPHSIFILKRIFAYLSIKGYPVGT